MTYLEESIIQRKGHFLKETRIDRNRKRLYYLYQGEELFIDIFAPSDYAFRNCSKGDLEEIEKNVNQLKGELTMKKSINFGGNNSEAKKTISFDKRSNKTAQVNNGMTLEGISAVKELKEMIQGMQKTLSNLTEKTEKLYEVSFNNNNDQVISLLTELVKLTKEKPAVNVQEVKKNTATREETNESNAGETGDAYDVFSKHFPGTADKDSFNDFYQSADFSNMESLEESFKTYNRKSEKLLCARRSNKAYLSAIWETSNKLAKGNVTSKSEKSNSPVHNVKYFSDSLGFDESTIKQLIEMQKQNDCFADEEEQDLLNLLLENGLDKNKEKEFDEFTDFIRAMF
jgi:hypothetical protein